MWPLDDLGDSIYVDLFGENDGTVALGKVAPSAATGIVGGAQLFAEGTGIDVPANSAFNWTGTESFSIEFWVKTPVLPSGENQVVIGRYDSGTGMMWWAGLHGRTTGDAGKVQFSLTDTSGATPVSREIIGSTVLDPGTWHHVVVIRDGNQNSIYANGVLEATLEWGFSDGFSSGVAALNIGWLNRSAGFHLSGWIDELALYNRALTPDEVTTHFNAGGAGNKITTLRPKPVADAGDGQINVKATTLVTLDGSGSEAGYPAAPIYAWLWEQTGDGPTVTLTDPDKKQATFTAPPGASNLSFTLTVTAQDGQKDIDTVTVGVVARVAPVADAGLPQTVTAGETVTLDGSGSSDADGDIVSYLWIQTGGSPSVTLSDAAVANPTFTAPAVDAAEALIFELTVTDDDDLTAAGQVTVTVNPAATSSPAPSGGGGGGGCFINTMF